MTTRVHAGDGRLLADYAIERRVFVPIEAMPRKVVLAFLAAEDATFYEHFGVDLPSVAGAVLRNVGNLLSDRRMVGASTITQQVAKNFLLSNEFSYDRKIKEAILAFRIERVLDKDRILELYLNKIYLGFGSYGVAAAALNYFNKSLVELTLGETAMLAALPKAPNNYHPRAPPRGRTRPARLGDRPDAGKGLHHRPGGPRGARRTHRGARARRNGHGAQRITSPKKSGAGSTNATARPRSTRAG